MGRKTYPPCPYCGCPTEMRDSACVYGRSYGDVLICTQYPGCDAFVGMHRDGSGPKGALADRTTREARKRAHAAFDPLWRSGRTGRNAAYRWLADKLGMAVADAHIGMFDADTCARVVEVCREPVEADRP